MSWTAQAFDRWYLVVYPHRDEAEARRAVALLARAAPLASRRVLDLGCGPGRHLGVLAESGARAVGLDQSAPLLAEAHRRLASAGAVRLVRGDMRALPFPAASFDGATSLFTTLGYDAEADDRRILAEVARVLVAGGFFLLDFLNRERVLAAGPSHSVVAREGYRISENRRLIDAGRRVAKLVRVEPIEGGDLLTEYEERVTLYGADELRDLVGGVGLALRHVWGGYDGAPFDRESSTRCILFAERKAA